jgi:hypothetical protein
MRLGTFQRPKRHESTLQPGVLGMRVRGPGNWTSGTCTMLLTTDRKLYPTGKTGETPCQPKARFRSTGSFWGKRFGFGKRQWLSKHMARFSATGRVMLRRKEWDHNRYPRCEGVIEDSDHILRCPAPSVRRQWLESLASLETKLEEYRTRSDICRVMLAKLRAWPHTASLSFSGLGLDVSVLDATRYQDHIGWGGFLLGRITGCWRDAQDEWIVLTSTKWKRSSARWVSRTTRAVWEVSWEMWMQRNAVYHDPAHRLNSATKFAKSRVHTTPNSTFQRDASIFPTISVSCFKTTPRKHNANG